MPDTDEGVEITESGRPRVPRPMPDRSDATQCPHCDADVGTGHAVCWNCSRDIRMKEQTEQEIMAEYETMVAKAELGLEVRNLRFFVAMAIIVLAAGALAVVLRPAYWGLAVLAAVAAALLARTALKSRRRIVRIRRAHGL